MNIKTLALITTLILSLFASTHAFAGTGEADMINVVETYKTQAENFGSNITKIAIGLLVALFTLELCWSILSRFIKGAQITPEEILSITINRIMTTFFLYWVINGNILKSITDGFALIGAMTIGDNISGPSDLFFIGVDIANKLTTGMTDGLTNDVINTAKNDGIAAAAVSAVSSVFPALIVGLADFFIILAFALIAAQYAVIMIQMYYFLSLYPLLLSFGATRFGKDISSKQYSTAIVIGVRMLAIYFVAGIGGSLSDTLQANMANLSLHNLAPMWSAVGVAALLGFLSVKLPAMASDMVSGTASLSAGDALAAGGAGAAAGAGAGAIMGGLLSAGGAAAGAANEGMMSLREAAGFGLGGTSSNAGGLSGMTSGYNPTTGLTDLTPSWMGGGNTSPSQAASMSGGANEGPTVYNAENGTIGPASSSPSTSSAGGSISGANTDPAAQPAQTTSSVSGGANASQPAMSDSVPSGVSSLSEATSTPVEGGSIGAATSAQSNAPDQTNNRSQATDAVRQGLQEVAQVETASGASVNIQLGHEEI
ncbi:MAG: hypothetical protein ACXV79_00690 [Methylobacter sp.]